MDIETEIIDSTVQILGTVVEAIQNYKRIPNRDVAKAGISSSQLCQIRKGTTSPSIDKLFMLSEGLDVPISILMGLVEDQRKRKSTRGEIITAVTKKIENLEMEKKRLEKQLAELEAR